MTDPTETTLSAGDQTAVLAQFGQTVKISDILQDVWIPESMVQVMERLAWVAALEVDTKIRDTNFTAGGSAQLCGTAVSRNSIATDGSFDMDVQEVRLALNSLEALKANPYPDGFYRGVIHQDVKNIWRPLLETISKKLVKLREHLIEINETIRRQAQLWEASETILPAPFVG